MKVLVNLYNWENPRLYSSETDLEKGDQVVVKGDFGNYVGVVVAVEVNTKEEPIQSILRKATQGDLKAFKENQEKEKEAKKKIREEIKRKQLAMKLAEVIISLDGGNITVVFAAEERVDFRDLVKDLSKIFHRSVRMHQIGSRDEAKHWGGCGVCGRELCCVKLLKTLPSISIETARLQQIAHRGSERISGQCGRLLCCLAYEAEWYKEAMKGMPEIGSIIKTPQGKGEVVEINALKQEIKVKLEKGKFLVFNKTEI